MKKPENLSETTELMVSADYKERFQAEYMQLLIRYNGLKRMLDNWDAGKLKFKSNLASSLTVESAPPWGCFFAAVLNASLPPYSEDKRTKNPKPSGKGK